MNHRWIRVGYQQFICRHCGMVKDAGRRHGHGLYSYPSPVNGTPVMDLMPRPAPPCGRSWPDGWRPLGASVVRPDLFQDRENTP